jgi:flagellar biosynthesis/type III secretory pathway chaperone
VRKAEEAWRKAEEAAAAMEREKQVRAVPASKVCQMASKKQALLMTLQRRAQEVAEDSEDAPEAPPVKVSRFRGAPFIH